MSKIRVLIIGIMIIFGAFSANAATWTVTKSANSSDGVCDGDCSLREAVAAADSGDTIVFNQNLIGQTFTLGGSEIVVTKRISIDGNLDGVNVAQISGSNTSRIFLIETGAGLDLKNAALIAGSGASANHADESGGAIFAKANGNLQLDRVSLRANRGRFGGAIYLNEGTHQIKNSSLTGNRSESATAILLLSGELFMSNTTLTGNSIDNINVNVIGCGAVCTSHGSITIRNSTIANNSARTGGGIAAGSGTISINLGNTIVAGNSATESAPDIRYVNNATLVSAGGNLIQDTQTVPAGTFTQTNDTTGINPLLAPTNSNQGGHPIFTHPLQAGSPARNTGINSLAVEPLSNVALTNDGRGANFPRISGGTVDKGAFEDQTNGSSLVVSKLADTNDNVCDTDCSLREAVFAASVDPGTDNITMAANVFGTMNVGSEIAIENQNVNIIGYPSISSNTLIVSGNNATRLFNIDNANITLTGFTIANGNGAGSSQPFGGGGLIAFGGNLTLNQMIIRNNTTAASDLGNGGGIAVISGGVVRIMNSTFNNNSSYASFAAKINAGVTYITNSTFANNSYRAPGEIGAGAVSVGGTLYMRNSTVANNRNADSTSGAGLFCGGTTTCNIGNSIFADNAAISGNDLFVAPGGTLQSVGGNLVENNTGFDNAQMSQTNDVIGVDPLLMSLADNGGNVPTMMLNPLSPAINTGINSNATDPFSAAALPNDARGSGYSRIVSIVDKGAFETLIPSAAGVSVSGRVFADGAGLRNAVVILTDSNGVSRTAQTGSFGYFKFEEVEAGETYTVSVMSKRFQFASQIISVTEEITELNFTAE